MVAYSFKRRFVAPIQAGLGTLPPRDQKGEWLSEGPRNLDPPIHPKRQTIRAERLGKSRHAIAGEALQLYCAMRTKQCELIGRAVCDAMRPIRLDFEHERTEVAMADKVAVWRTPQQLDAFARSDGFGDWAELRAFWREEHGDLDAFLGIIITWRPQ
jgi:hypothetical protein